MPNYGLWCIILVEGFVTLAIQMLTIRQLMPFVGNSVMVTSLIIGIFLLALALGYQRGGLVPKEGLQRLIRNFGLSAIWSGIGLSYVFLASWFFIFNEFMHLNLYVLLLGYLLLVTAPMIYWLGQTVPIVMNLWNATHQRAGEIGGRVLQLSTLGSFLGAILTSIILMNLLGLGWSVFVAASLLLFMAWFLSVLKKNSIINMILFASLLTLLFWVNVIGSARWFVASNNYAQYRIIDHAQIEDKTGKVLNVNRSFSSLLTPQNEAFWYIERMKQAVFHDLHLRNQPILVLGAGGFTFSAQGTYDNDITYVDIDPDILNIVQKNYLKNIPARFVGADARVFVQQAGERYAAILVDAYSHELTIPTHLLTVEFFASINKILLPKGVAIFNMIIDPLLTDLYSKTVDASLRAVFQSCVSFPHQYMDAATNVVYVCTRNDDLDLVTLLKKSHFYYTDDLNRSTWDQQFLRYSQ